MGIKKYTQDDSQPRTLHRNGIRRDGGPGGRVLQYDRTALINAIRVEFSVVGVCCGCFLRPTLPDH